MSVTNFVGGALSAKRAKLSEKGASSKISHDTQTVASLAASVGQE